MFIFPQAFSIVNNKAKKAVIYTTTDTTWNVMTFTFNNYTTAALSLAGGTPAYPVQQQGPTSLVIDFSNILTNDEAGALKITDANNQWDSTFYLSSDAKKPSVWLLTPKAAGSLAASDSVVFTISNLACVSQTNNNFDVRYYNIAGYNDMPSPYAYLISLLAPPVGNVLPIDYGYMSVIHPIGPQTGSEADTDYLAPITPIEIDITYDNNFPIKNGFTIYLKNTSANSLEPHNTPLGNASITVSFLFSYNGSYSINDTDAITNQSLGDNININIDPETSVWTTVQHISGTPNWQFIPQSPEVMFAYETVKLEITNVITELLVAPDTLSTVYIQFNNIPGYQDVVYTMEMLKETAVASIPGFNANPTNIGYNTPYTNTNLTWTTEVANRVTLEYSDKDGNKYLFDSAKGQISLDATNYQPNPAPNAENTTFSLKAYDNNANVLAQASVYVNEPPVVINPFTASSYLVNILGSNQTTITWAVANAQTVTLQGQPVAASGSQQFTINNTTVFTLVAKPYGTVQPTVTQTFIIYAVKNYAPIPVGSAGNGTVWQSLPLTLLNNTNLHIYVSNAGANNGTIYQVSQPNKTTINPSFSGNIMALTPDKSILYVAQVQSGAPSGVTSYNTTTGARIDGAPFPGPPPYCMGVSPDQTLLFAAQQNNCTAVSIFNLNNGSISYNQDVTVGNSPRNIVFLNGNAYIPNYRSGTVSVISLSNLSAPPGTITLNQGEPRAMAVMGNKIYVACEQDNIVVVIDTANNNAVTPITCDWRPFQLEFNQNQSLLFVCNFGSNTVSVINTANNAVTNLTVGNSPAAARISNSGNLLFVSNYCDNTMSVIDLSNNQQRVVGSLPLDANSGNPVDITTYNANNYYTDLFVAKEYFTNRTTCASPLPAPANLQMSVLSIQELGGNPQMGAEEDTSTAGAPQATN